MLPLALLLLQPPPASPLLQTPPPGEVGFPLGGARGPAAAAQAPIPAAIAAIPAFDCAGGIDSVAQRIRATPNIETAEPPPGSPFTAFRDPARNMIFVVTGPGMPARPGVVRVTVVEVDGQTAAAASACVFGDRSQSSQLVNQVRALLGPVPPGSAQAPPPAPAPVVAAPTPARRP